MSTTFACSTSCYTSIKLVLAKAWGRDTYFVHKHLLQILESIDIDLSHGYIFLCWSILPEVLEHRKFQWQDRQLSRRV